MSPMPEKSMRLDPLAGLTRVPMSRRRLLWTAAGSTLLAPTLGYPFSAFAAQGEASPVAGGTVSIIVAANPASWDLTKSTWTTWQAVAFLYDRLLTFDANEELQPSLATAWEISEDGLEYALTLRDDVTFHDGTPFNAESVKVNVQRHLDQPDSASFTTYEPVETVEVTGDHSVVIRLKDVRPNFAYEGLAQWGAIQLSPTAFAEGSAAFDAHPVGTGPFIFDSYEPGSEIRYLRNESYWGGAPPLERIVVRVIPEPSVQLVELESGNVDVTQILPQDAVPMEELGMTVEENIAPGAHFVSLNVSKAPTDELAVRKAIARAIDRDAMIETLLFGHAEISRAGVNSASVFYSEDVPMIEYNPEEAGQLLDEAGWVLGDDGVRQRDGQPLTVNLLSTDYLTWGLMNQVIQEQLAAIGIASEISSLEWNAYLDQWRENQGDWNVTYHSQGSLMARTEAIQASWVPNDYWTISQIDDATDPDLVALAEELQALNDEFVTTLDDARRKEISVQAQTLFQEHQLTAWLWHGATITAIKPDVEGYELSHAGRVVELAKAWRG